MSKTQQVQSEYAERMRELVLKCNHRIKLNINQIDLYISKIYKHYNELQLIHESKLGHSLKDMQQFLEYQQSSDEQI